MDHRCRYQRCESIEAVMQLCLAMCSCTNACHGIVICLHTRMYYTRRSAVSAVTVPCDDTDIIVIVVPIVGSVELPTNRVGSGKNW